MSFKFFEFSLKFHFFFQINFLQFPKPVATMYQLSLVCSCNTKECKYSMSVILRHMTTQIIKNSFCYWMNIYWSGSLVVIYCCHFSFILGRLTDWSMYKWNSYFMLCHHAYLHGKSLTTIFSVVFCYMTLHYTSEKPLTPTGWLCISKWLPSSLHDCPSVNQSLCEPVN